MDDNHDAVVFVSVAWWDAEAFAEVDDGDYFASEVGYAFYVWGCVGDWGDAFEVFDFADLVDVYAVGDVVQCEGEHLHFVSGCFLLVVTCHLEFHLFWYGNIGFGLYVGYEGVLCIWDSVLVG